MSGKRKSVIRSITAAQRRCNTLCARGYKDIRYAVTTVLAGIPPLDITIEKRSIRHRYKKKYFPISWNRMKPFNPFDNARTLPLKALDNMQDKRVMKMWDKAYQESVLEGHWCHTDSLSISRGIEVSAEAITSNIRPWCVQRVPIQNREEDFASMQVRHSQSDTAAYFPRLRTICRRTIS